MTELLSGVDAPSDAELISRVRGGDTAAYGDLFSRHVEAARRLGRQLVRGPDVDDLVSEAFAKVLQVLQTGGGPDVAFRAYLLTAVRRLHVDRVRATARVQPTDDMTKYDPGVPFQDTAVAGFESGAAARAFASLPERWQLVLWHLEVEGQKPADIAPLLGMSANSVSALAYRAREGLRQAFLTMHLADSPTVQCQWVNGHLGAYVRQGLSKRDTAKVEGHLDECRRCMAMYLELTEVNSNLSAIIAPLLLGAAAAGYVSSAGGAVGTGGLVALAGRLRDVVVANTGAATGAAVAAGVAAVATTAFLIAGPDDREVIAGADREIVVTTPAERAPVEAERDPRPGGRTAGDDEPPASAPGVPGASPEGSLPLALPTQSPTESAGSSPTESPVPSDLVPPTDAAVSGPGAVTDPPGGGTSESPLESPTTSTAPSPTGSASPTRSPSPTGSATSPAPSSPPPSQPPSSGTPTSSDVPTPTTTATPPTPTETPPEATSPLPETDLSVSAEINGHSVDISVHGSPELPPSIQIDLTSDPDGIKFAEATASCDLAATTAVCSTDGGLVSSLADAAFGSAFGDSFSDGDSNTFGVSLPLAVSTEQPETEVTVSVSAPGYIEPANDDDTNSSTFTYVPPPPPDLVSAAFTQNPEDRTGARLTVKVLYAPRGVQTLTFHLQGAGAVKFTDVPDDCNLPDGATAKCSVSEFGTYEGEFTVNVPFGQLKEEKISLLLVGDPDPMRITY